MSVKSKLNEEEMTKMCTAVGTFRDDLHGRNEMIYTIISELPQVNGHHAQMEVHLRKSRFLTNNFFVSDEFRKYVEDYFQEKGFEVQINQGGSIINVWMPEEKKKGK